MKWAVSSYPKALSPDLNLDLQNWLSLDFKVLHAPNGGFAADILQKWPLAEVWTNFFLELYGIALYMGFKMLLAPDGDFAADILQKWPLV